MFADDCTIFRIWNADDTSPESFQNDLNKLTEWTYTYLYIGIKFFEM